MYIDGNVFPSSVLECDITEEVLQRAFLQCLEGQGDLDLILMKPVTIGFYRDLHHYLSHWPLARSATKTSVGKFYALIDVNFKLYMQQGPTMCMPLLRKLPIQPGLGQSLCTMD